MSRSIHTLASALAVALATLVPAKASKTPRVEPIPTAFAVPTVFAAAFHDRSVAVNAAEVRRQGGLLVPAATRWVKAPDAASSAEAFKAPGVISVAYRTRGIAANAAEVLRQGGFATAGVARWVPGAPAKAEAKVEGIRLGAL